MSIDRAAARQAVRASGERWLRTRADALHLQRGRRLARVLDLDVMTGRAGDARVRSRTLVLARDPRRPDTPAAACPPVPGERGILKDGTLWWWAPADPALPGLTLTADPDALAALLGTAPGRARLTWRGYRPRDRAVLAVEATGDDGVVARTFLKVLPPARAARVARRMAAAGAAGVPVPAVLAAPERGVLPLASVPGLPWRALLAGPEAAALEPARVAALLDRLPPVPEEPPASAPPAGAAGGADADDGGPAVLLEHATWAAVVLDPEAQDEAAARADRLRAALAAGDPGPRVPVHGDLHPGNLHVDAAGERITGVLDADDLGTGHRVDDWAVLIAHLEAGAADLGAGGAALRAVAARFRRHARTEVDEVALAARVAIVLAALAAQPTAPRAVRSARRAAADAALARVGR
ncbi:phosphotransferase [Micrococcus luteus]|uniref:phosphotransferase n=1 Tax=Micrococcus luteus TaxID=1270 RepID=UPI0011A372CF|nr:phosphotransferase [Micrococcus luteus]MCV7452271.1 phosphotransferase [Micrococcus luteus]MCV7470021.1 phosphotransferase [Micrococcus luteus]MCV7696399.1 phosphotransferase [Micrococcus luteus]